MTGPLRIGLNLLWLRPGQVGGTEGYATRVVRALVDHAAADVELHGFASQLAIDSHPASIGRTSAHAAPATVSSPIRRVALERTWLARQPVVVDVMHHLGGTCPRRSRHRVVVTIHDLQPLDQPSNFPALKRAWLAMAIPAAVERADVVVTPSDWVAETVIERFALDRDRVVTVSAYAEPGPIDVPRQSVSEQVASLIAGGPFVLYPAMTLAHKNHRMLFDAFAEVVDTRPELRLVCVGSVDRDHAEIVAAADAAHNVHLLGYVPRSDLDALLSAAEALVFPSRYEGFGLPVLEAQQRGLPVIASTAGALVEVSGGAAVLLDPDDIEAWVDAMRTPFDTDLRKELVTAGRENAARYSAERTASAQLDAYRRATGA